MQFKIHMNVSMQFQTLMEKLLCDLLVPQRDLDDMDL